MLKERCPKVECKYCWESLEFSRQLSEGLNFSEELWLSYCPKCKRTIEVRFTQTPFGIDILQETLFRPYEPLILNRRASLVYRRHKKRTKALDLNDILATLTKEQLLQLQLNLNLNLGQ